MSEPRFTVQQTVARGLTSQLNANILLYAGEVAEVRAYDGKAIHALFRRLIGEENSPRAARVLDGVDVSHLTPDRLAQAGVAIGSGRQRLLPSLTGQEHAALRVKALGLSIAPRAAWQWCKQHFTFLRMAGESVCGDFSGGQQQAAMLALCCLGCPRLVIIEEPWIGLSGAARIEGMNLIERTAYAGTAFLFLLQARYDDSNAESGSSGSFVVRSLPHRPNEAAL